MGRFYGNINEYQILSKSSAVYPNELALAYLALGLSNEAGEVAGKIKKFYRGDDGEGQMSIERRDQLLDEIGDVLWYLTQLATELGFSMNLVMETNHNKLAKRREEGTIMGDGDTR